MEASRETAVRILNGLIETTLDSAHGYDEAARNAGDGQFKALFAERSRRRLDLARQLQQEVRTFGGKPQDEQSLLGKAHDTCVVLRNALGASGDATAVIAEVERSEDLIKAMFEKAMSGRDLPSPAVQVVTRAYETIRADHDDIRRLKPPPH